MIELLYRSCEGDAWRQVASVCTLNDTADELASWTGPRLSHGDLVRVVAAPDHRRRVTPRLYVCDVSGETSALRTVPIDAPSWDEATDAEAMLRRCGRVDKRRVVMTACDIARVVLPLVPAGEDRPRVAIETAERWCRGEATVDEVMTAATAAWAAARAAARAAREARAAARAAAWAWAAARAAAEAAAEAAAGAAARAAAWAAAWAEALPPHDFASIVRRRIPLPVLACSLLGLRDPLPVDVTPIGGDR